MALDGVEIKDLLNHHPASSGAVAAVMHKRLRKELKDLKKDPPAFFSAGPVGEDISQWEAKILGPSDSPYSGGVFVVSICCSEWYPFRSPEVTFKTKVYHPNISSTGFLSISCLFNTEWNPTFTLAKLLLSIHSMLAEPMVGHYIARDVAEVYVTDRAKYEATARAWTQKYAMDSFPGEIGNLSASHDCEETDDCEATEEP